MRRSKHDSKYPPPANNQVVRSKVTKQEDSLIPGRYIVVFKDQWEGRINNEVAQRSLQFVNNKISEFKIEERNIKSKYEYALHGFTATLTDAQLKAIRMDPKVDFVEQDRKFKVESYSKTMGFLNIENNSKNNYLMSQTIPWGVSRVGGPLNGTGKKAWIIDTGIDLDHPDLNVDVINSASFVASESANDIVGHGTHVAGIIAAKNNSQQVVGVAAGATVVAVKVLHQDPKDNTFSDVVDGVNYVAGKASSNDVINMSLGAYDPSGLNQSIDVAVINAANSGLKFTIAAGNSALDAGDFTPARVNHSNVWIVSAFRQGDEFTQVFDWNTPNCNSSQSLYVGSNYGNPPVKYSAPGENIKSLWKNGGTYTTCGTSMAAPHVAGLLLAGPQGNGVISFDTVTNDPDATPDAIAVADKPLSVIVSGPTALVSGQAAPFTANVSDEEGSVSYQWYYRISPTGAWYSGGTSSLYQHTFYNSGPTMMEAALKVSISSAGENASDIKTVYVAPDCNNLNKTGSGGSSSQFAPIPC